MRSLVRLLTEVSLCILFFAMIYFFLATPRNMHFQKTTYNPRDLDIRFVDSLYFSLVTQSTVGYGSIVPISTISKVFASLQIFSTFIFVLRWATLTS